MVDLFAKVSVGWQCSASPVQAPAVDDNCKLWYESTKQKYDYNFTFLFFRPVSACKTFCSKNWARASCLMSVQNVQDIASEDEKKSRCKESFL